jgi:hypothetical protein
VKNGRACDVDPMLLQAGTLSSTVCMCMCAFVFVCVGVWGRW